MENQKKLENMLHEAAQKTEEACKRYFEEGMAGNTVTADAMQYSLLGGGKRIRAFLCLQLRSCSEPVKKRQCPLPAHWKWFTPIP